MTIKKRLFCSNILMIVVPAVIVAFIGLLCMALLWISFQGGGGMHLEDGEDLRYIGRDMAGQIEGFMTDTPDTWTSQMDGLASMTESGALRIIVTQNGGLAYIAGEEQPADSQLVQAADIIDETDAFISVGDRSVYRIHNTTSGGSWSLYLFGTRQDHLDSGLKVILALAAIGLIFIVFLTILMTNRFLTRFVVRKIEEPLDLLSEGARRLGDGDLDYRIVYAGEDEFAPVCTAFNEMAARLKDSVGRTRRDEESRKELLAGISHDLRSPLTSIRAYVEGLLDGVAKTEEAKQRYLHTIHTKAEDIDRLVSQLFLYLELNNYQVEIASDGITGLERGLHGDFDLILLDLMLPGMDGFAICRRLREETDIPILMVTARREDIDKIRGLGLGADDYIEKPFSPSVLVARVRAHLARYQRLTGGQKKANPELRAGNLRLNTVTRRVFVNDQEVELKNREYELLQFLMLHPDMVFSREELYEKIWGLDAMGDNATVAVHINRIREKIEPDPSHPRYIQTVWGAGCRFKGQ